MVDCGARDDAVEHRLKVGVVLHPLLGDLQNTVYLLVGLDRRRVHLLHSILEIIGTVDLIVRGYVTKSLHA